MESPLFFSQLVLFALIWLFIILHLPWPQRAVTVPVAPVQPEPLKPTRHRSTEPALFEGRTHKPHGVRCERETTPPQASPPVPPAPMPSTNRRPCPVDTSRHCCPPSDGDYRGWLGLNHLRANGHPSGGPWRPCSCTSGTGSLLETHGTLFQGFP